MCKYTSIPLVVPVGLFTHIQTTWKLKFLKRDFKTKEDNLTSYYGGQRSVEMQHRFPIAKICDEICSFSVLGWLQWWKYHQLF